MESGSETHGELADAIEYGTADLIKSIPMDDVLGVHLLATAEGIVM